MMSTVSEMRKKDGGGEEGQRGGEEGSVSGSGREVSARAVPTDAAVIWATCPRMPAGHPEAWLGDSS